MPLPQATTVLRPTGRHRLHLPPDSRHRDPPRLHLPLLINFYICKDEYQPYSASHHNNGAHDRGIQRMAMVLLRKASFVILFTSLRPSIDWSSFNTSVHIKQWRFCPPSIVIPRIASRHWVVMVFWGCPYSRLSGNGSISLKIIMQYSIPHKLKNLESSQV